MTKTALISSTRNSFDVTCYQDGKPVIRHSCNIRHSVEHIKRMWESGAKQWEVAEYIKRK